MNPGKPWEWAIAIGCVVFVLAVVYTAAIKRASNKTQSQPSPWVIYEHGDDKEFDRDAISTWIMKRARCGCGWSGADNELVIHLHSSDDATPRSSLLQLAAQARKKLPEGCPITIRVETLDEAIGFEKSQIKLAEVNIERLKRIHVETEHRSE